MVSSAAAAAALYGDDAWELAITTAAFRLSPASFARFIGDFRNAVLNASWFSARMSVASVNASLPAMNSRAANGDPSANGTENF